MSFRWVIELEASEEHVADGFDPANHINGQPMGGELSALGRIVDWWRPEDCRVRIVKAPSPTRLEKARR